MRQQPDLTAVSLRNMQQDFATALFSGTADRLLDFIGDETGSTKETRLDIYRNNVFHSLSEALGDLYPAVRRLVGERFFRAAAVEYLRQHPLRRAAMVYFGEDFPQFLRDFEHTADLAYLADVAMTELAWHGAYHARDARPLTLEELGAVPPEALAASRILLHPSLKLVRSDFPVFRIWYANREDSESDEIIDLESGEECIYAVRPGYEVVLRSCSCGGFTLLDTLGGGATLEEAMLAAQEADPDYVSSESLAQCIRDGCFIKISEQGP